MHHPSLLYPAVIEHAAAFLGKSPWEVSRDGELLFAAHARAYETYGHSPVVCGIDVYHTEVEAWGVPVLASAGGRTPALGNPLFADPEAIPGLRTLDIQKDGRFPLLLQAAQRLARLPGCEVQVPIAGPVSIAEGLLGFETVLMELAEESVAMVRAIDFLARHQGGLARDLLNLGFHPVVYESGAAPPLLSPDLFRQVVAPALKTVLASGVEAGAPLPCIVGGDLASVAGPLLDAGPGMVICPAETDQRAFMNAAADYPNIAVRLNMPASVMGSGDRATIFTEIDHLLPLALGHPRGLLGTGVVAYDCDPELIRAAQEHTRHTAEIASR